MASLKTKKGNDQMFDLGVVSSIMILALSFAALFVLAKLVIAGLFDLVLFSAVIVYICLLLDSGFSIKTTTVTILIIAILYAVKIIKFNEVD